MRARHGFLPRWFEPSRPQSSGVRSRMLPKPWRNRSGKPELRRRHDHRKRWSERLQQPGACARKQRSRRPWKNPNAGRLHGEAECGCPLFCDSAEIVLTCEGSADDPARVSAENGETIREGILPGLTVWLCVIGLLSREPVNFREYVNCLTPFECVQRAPNCPNTCLSC